MAPIETEENKDGKLGNLTWPMAAVPFLFAYYFPFSNILWISGLYVHSCVIWDELGVEGRRFNCIEKTSKMDHMFVLISNIFNRKVIETNVSNNFYNIFFNYF